MFECEHINIHEQYNTEKSIEKLTSVEAMWSIANWNHHILILNQTQSIIGVELDFFLKFCVTHAHKKLFENADEIDETEQP